MINEDKYIPELLKDILKNVAQSEDIKNYEVFAHENPIKGEGFLSEFFTGEVLNKDNGKKTQIAIKKLPANSSINGLGNEWLFKIEIYFYSKIMSELDKFQRKKGVHYPFEHIPRYLAGNIDSKNTFIAMENLKTAGYTLWDKKKYLDRDHLELIFKTYGKFHALSFTFKQENTEAFENHIMNLTNSSGKSSNFENLITFIRKSFLSALETFDPISEADILTRLRAVENVGKAIKNVQDYKGNHGCLIHGDCWSNNMLFKYKESGELEDIRLLDFQGVRSSTPVHDLSYFFYSGASKEEMDKLDYYLDLYHKSFSSFASELGLKPEKMFSMDVFKKEWKQYSLMGIFLGCQAWAGKLMDQDEIENVLKHESLPPDQYWALWSEHMDIIRNRADFKERVRNIYLHAVEYGIL